MEELQQDQKQVENPPGRVGAYNLPTFEQSGI